MRAVILDQFGDEEVLRIGEAAAPVLGADDIRIAVTHAGVNRADLLQREGHYPPPAGASPILGLECAGEVMETGANVDRFRRGDRVMALLAGGGYAEEVVVDAGSAMHIPDALDDAEGGAFPEVFLTAFLNVFMLAKLREGETLLVHGGSSGVGTAATTLAKLAGANVIVTAGSDDKCRRCVEAGADHAINYRSDEFPQRVLELTAGRGADVVLDHLGASYLPRDLACLAIGGRVAIIGSMGGQRKAEIDVSTLLGKRQQIIGSTLRARSAAEKAAIVGAFIDRFYEELVAGKIRPAIDSVFALDQVAEAHRRMASSVHFGKIVLKVR